MRKLLLLLVSFYFVVSCSSADEDVPTFDKKFSPYIGSYTAGLISKKSTVNIYFNKDISELKVGELLSSDLLEFSPNIEGDLILRDKRHLEFSPKSLLNSDQVYTAELALKLLSKV